MLYDFCPTVALYATFTADLAENAKNKVNDDVVCLVTEEAAATAVVVIVVLSVSENQFNKIISFNRTNLSYFRRISSLNRSFASSFSSRVGLRERQSLDLYSALMFNLYAIFCL